MKGVIHTIEVVIAIAMLLIAVATIFSPMPKPDLSPALLTEKGYSALQYLEDSGQLRPIATSQNADAVASALEPLLRSDFEVEICDPVCIGTLQERVVALDYFIAGYQTYQPVHLRLYLW